MVIEKLTSFLRNIETLIMDFIWQNSIGIHLAFDFLSMCQNLIRM